MSQQSNPMIKDFEHANIQTYYQHIQKQLKNGKVQPFKKSCQNFVFFDSLFSSNKSKQVFDSCLKDVQPNLRLSNGKKTKNLLRSLSKVFVQILAEQVVIVMNISGKKQIDQETINQAYRRVKEKDNYGLRLNASVF